jgi:hypothetical protein
MPTCTDGPRNCFSALLDRSASRYAKAVEIYGHPVVTEGNRSSILAGVKDRMDRLTESLLAELATMEGPTHARR